MLIPSIPAVLVIPRLSIVTTSKPAFTSAGTWYVFHTRPGLPAPMISSTRGPEPVTT